MNWANRVTVFRIILVPIFIMAVLYHKLYFAFAVFIIAAITDGLDGYIARTFNQKTQLGAMLDPIADKMIIGSAFISFSIVAGLPAYLKMPVYVPIIIISRDVIILLGAIIIYLHSGKLDIKPTLLGKVTTFCQMITITALLLRFMYSNWIWNFTTIVTVISGLDYIRIGSGMLHEKV